VTRVHGRSVVALVALASSAFVVRGARPAPAAGSISGKVTYTGTPPKMKPIDMAKEPFCARLHAAAPVLTENAVTGPGNALRWVVVYVSAGDQGGAPSTETVRLDQRGCQYIPHVLVLHPDQPLDIYNDDSTSHNIHPLAKINPEWNKSQPIGAPPIHTKWEKPEFIAVKCNVHPWMHGWHVVLAGGSHAAVTGEDGGFSLQGLPPGKYTVTAWHEQFGSQTQDVTITGNETKTVNFVLKATPY
jgi:Carboxypeptidase regulatory-like domain